MALQGAWDHFVDRANGCKTHSVPAIATGRMVPRQSTHAPPYIGHSHGLRMGEAPLRFRAVCWGMAALALVECCGSGLCQRKGGTRCVHPQGVHQLDPV